LVRRLARVRRLSERRWMSEKVKNELVAAARVLDEALRGLRFGEPVTHVYRPLAYAWEAHEAYLTRFGSWRKRVVF